MEFPSEPAREIAAGFAFIGLRNQPFSSGPILQGMDRCNEVGVRFSPLRFTQYADELSRAVYNLSEQPVKYRITEPTFFFHKERSPGEIMEAPVGPYRYAPGAKGLKRTPQYEEVKMSITGLEPGSIKAKLAEIRQKAAERQAQGIALIESTHSTGLAKVDAATESVVKKINTEVDNALQEYAEYTNGPEGEAGTTVPGVKFP